MKHVEDGIHKLDGGDPLRSQHGVKGYDLGFRGSRDISMTHPYSGNNMEFQRLTELFYGNFQKIDVAGDVETLCPHSRRGRRRPTTA